MRREFDVGDVVDVLTAEVAAGADGLTRTVARSVLASRSEHLGSFRADDFVITTAATLDAVGEPSRSFVARLRAAGVSGIAIRLDRTDSLDRELLAAADEASLPVVTVSDVLELAQLESLLIDARTRRLERLIDIQSRFAQVALDGGADAEVAATLHDLIGQPVAVVGSDGSPTVVVPAGRSSQFDAPTSVARQPIGLDEHHRGEVVVLTDGTPLGIEELFALETAANEIMVRLVHLDATARTSEAFESISLEQLVGGDPEDVERVTERARSFGWDLSLPRAVLLASIDPPVEEAGLPGTLAAIAAAARATLGADSIVWTRRTSIGVLLAPERHRPAERRSLADILRRELDLQVRTVTISIGVGRQVAQVGELPHSFQQACRAVEVGRWAKGRHVTEVFDELGLERLLASTPEPELADFVDKTIGSLLDHDRAHSTDLVETLEIWLQTRNMAEAARRIHVHYNTLKNRLDRIEAILGPVIADATRSLECEVALYVARHYDGPWSAPAEPTTQAPEPR